MVLNALLVGSQATEAVTQPFYKNGVLGNFSKFTVKHLYQRLWHRCFTVNFEEFLRTPFLTSPVVVL